MRQPKFSEVMILICLGLLCLVGQYFWNQDLYSLRQNGIEVDAKVAPSAPLNRMNTVTVVEFTTTEGVEVTAQLQYANSNDYLIGQTLKVKYHPQNPVYVVPSSGGAIQVGYVMGVILLGLGLIGLFGFLKTPELKLHHGDIKL